MGSESQPASRRASWSIGRSPKRQSVSIDWAIRVTIPSFQVSQTGSIIPTGMTRILFPPAWIQSPILARTACPEILTLLTKVPFSDPRSVTEMSHPVRVIVKCLRLVDMVGSRRLHSSSRPTRNWAPSGKDTFCSGVVLGRRSGQTHNSNEPFAMASVLVWTYFFPSNKSTAQHPRTWLSGFRQWDNRSSSEQPASRRAS